MTHASLGPGSVLPDWQVSAWLNTRIPLTLDSLHGRVVVLHAFQMLCPGCVTHGLPQAERVHQTFAESGVAVVGLHTVFEHHAVMTAEALKAFVHEYRWSFPIGIDQPAGGSAPSVTMTRYGLRGTPSCLVLDRQGRVRLHKFGAIDDLVLGALLGRLIAQPERADESSETGQEPRNAIIAPPARDTDRCDDATCRMPTAAEDTMP